MEQAIKPVKPLDGLNKLQRKDLARYFNRIGRGVNCRIDVPILVHEDIKWAATVFSELSKELTNLGWEDKRNDIWRILAARQAMEQARHKLALTNSKVEATKIFHLEEIKSSPNHK